MTPRFITCVSGGRWCQDRNASGKVRVGVGTKKGEKSGFVSPVSYAGGYTESHEKAQGVRDCGWCHPQGLLQGSGDWAKGTSSRSMDAEKDVDPDPEEV